MTKVQGLCVDCIMIIGEVRVGCEYSPFHLKALVPPIPYLQSDLT